MNARKFKKSKHHIRPRSRFQPNAAKRTKDWYNVVELPEDFHRALHVIFGNLDPYEYEDFLRRVLQPGLSWNGRELEKLRQDIMNETKKRGEP